MCHFEWARIAPSEVSPRIHDAVGQMATILVAHAAIATQRPEPDRWSALEYGAHLRDVMVNVRDRIILAVVEDVPSPYPLYREERVTLGLYANETVPIVAADLESAASLFTRTFDTLRTDYVERTMIYSRLLGDERTIGWTGAQVLHECEHHLQDVRDNVTRLEGRETSPSS